MILRSHKLSSKCSTIVGVRILVTFLIKQVQPLFKSFIRSIGVEIHRESIVSGLIGMMIIVGFILLFGILGKFGGN